MTSATDLTGVDAVIAEARRDFECKSDNDLVGALAVLASEAREEVGRLRKILADSVPVTRDADTIDDEGAEAVL